MPSKIGYARVSTLDQNPDLQISALKEAGCEHIFIEKASGAIRERPELEAALKFLRSGEELIVWKLDRLGRDFKHMLEIVERLNDRNITFRSLTENIETGGPTGKLVLHIFGAFSEYERNLNKERTMAGLIQARSEGRTGGRPKALSDDDMESVKQMISAGGSPAEIIDKFNLAKSTGYRLHREISLSLQEKE